MGKQQSPPTRAGASLGKGKVTPVQIAFLVHRYLADNRFAATLASFQSEAADLFPRARSREAPKGLLGLADILDEYVSLKEQRIIVEQEKRRVEALLRGIHDAVQTYRSGDGGGGCSPPLPSPCLQSPPLLAPPTPVVAVAPAGRISSANPSNRTPAGPMVQNTPILRPSSAAAPTISPPTADASCSNKRKHSKPSLKAPPAPKRPRGRSQAEVSTIEGTPEPSQTVQKCPPGDLTSATHQHTDPLVGESSATNSVFAQPPDSNSDTSSTSPKTPQRAYHSQGQKMGSPLAGSSISQSVSANASRELTPSRCSIISSKRVVVSPYKNECYYAVEKSCCISSSPLKPNPKKAGKRLDFDDSDMPTSSGKPAVAESPASSTDDKVEDLFDFDIADFDIDFSFAEFLVDDDLQCQEFTKSHQPIIKPSSDSISRFEGESESICLDMSQDLSVPWLSSLSGIMSDEGVNVTEGHESVTSVKTITKCIKIVSPAKSTRNSCLEPL